MLKLFHACSLATELTESGSYASSLDIATDVQSTSETTSALHAIGAITPVDLQKANAYLQADTTNNTENLSRIILNNSLVGIEITPLITELLKHSNPDGGFAEFEGFASTPLDTAFALQALAINSTSPPQVVEHAITYLLSTQNTEGGFSLSESNESSVYITSLCLSALQPFIFQYNLAEILAPATEYLFAQQLSSGEWNTHWETAIALSSLAPITTDITRYADAVSALKLAQKANGSWDDSVYTTALALHVLHKIENIELPIDISTGVLTGRVVNALSGLPLQGVSITIQGAESQIVETAIDGHFTAANLSAPENYTITYDKAGYQQALQQTSIVKGQLLHLGSIQLTPLPNTGFFTGVVSDAETGVPISGASINVSHDTGDIVVSTETDGSYFLNINPGSIAITVTAVGYNGVTASGTIALGGTLSFSPALYKKGSPDPGADAILSGSIIDTETLLPLLGVSVSIVNLPSATLLSNADGGFVLAGIQTGELQIEFQLIGYKTTRLDLVLATGGSFQLEQVQLRPLIAGSETAISGTVIDETTGHAVAGALIKIAGLTTTSDPDGKFQLNGITALDLSVSASATGYLTFTSQLVLQESGSIQINIPLQVAQRGELRIVSMQPDQLNYDAYHLVTINTIVQNTSAFNQQIQLLGEVVDANTQLIQRFPFSLAHAEAELGDHITIGVNESVKFEGLWPTGAHIAENYQIILKVIDANTGQVLAEKATTVTINETRDIQQLQVNASPGYSHQNQTENIELIGLFNNLSNIDIAAEYTYSVLDPDGQMIQSGALSLQIIPSQRQESFVIDNFMHTFDKSGIYTIELQHQTGVVARHIMTGFISVTPNIRIELNQTLLPENIIPDGDKRIRVGIEIKGVQQQ